MHGGLMGGMQLGANGLPRRIFAGGVLGSEGIKWNFTQFLVSRDGKVLKRYAPTTKPSAIAKDIEKALQET